MDPVVVHETELLIKQTTEANIKLASVPFDLAIAIGTNYLAGGYLFLNAFFGCAPRSR